MNSCHAVREQAFKRELKIIMTGKGSYHEHAPLFPHTFTAAHRDTMVSETSNTRTALDLIELMDKLNPPRVTWWSTMVFAFLVPMFALLFVQIVTTLPVCGPKGNCGCCKIPGLCCAGKMQKGVQNVVRKIMEWKWACCCHKWCSDCGLKDGFPAIWFVITIIACAFASNMSAQLYISHSMGRMNRAGVAITDNIRVRKCKADRNGWITFLGLFGYLILRLIVVLTKRLSDRTEENTALTKRIKELEAKVATTTSSGDSGSGGADAKKSGAAKASAGTKKGN